MKHPSPSKIEPNPEAIVSTLVPNCLDNNTYPGPTIGDNAPSNDAVKALHGISGDQAV